MAMTLQQFTAWYLASGPRDVKGIKLPMLKDISQLTYPAFTTLHYVQPLGTVSAGVNLEEDEENDLVLGPSPTDPLLKNHSSVNFLIDIARRYDSDPVGNAKVVVTMVTEPIAKYINSSTHFKKYQGNESLMTDKNIVIHTYTALDTIYRYTQYDRMAWDRWYNWYHTVLTGVKKAMEDEPNRNHFIMLEPPATFNSLSTMRNTLDSLNPEEPYVKRMSLKWSKYYHTDQDRTFYDLWLYFGTGKHLSLFQEILGGVDLTKLNIMWQVGSLWSVVNIGRLSSFILTDENKRGTTTATAMEATWLIYVMRLGSNYSPVDNNAPEDNPDLSNEEKIAQLDKPVRELNIQSSAVTTNKIDVKIEKAKKPIISKNAALDKLKKEYKEIDKDKSTEGASDDIDDAVVDEAIKRDLDQLEALSAQRAIESTYEERYKAYVPVAADHTSNINKHIDAMEKRGQLSAKEVARLKRAALSFKEAKDPWGGKETIAEKITITKEMLAVPEYVPLASDIPGVTDKSMLYHSLQAMNPVYVENIIQRDILGALMHLQQGRYIVTDVKVTRTTTMMDDYEVMTAKVMTLRGKEKLIRIQYPVYKKDGSYLVGGVKQRTRNQHIDLPIRKVSPIRVALTTSISKLFVVRTERAAFNYTRWLNNGLRGRVMNPEDNEITNVVYGKVFDRTRHLPRGYSALAMIVSSFEYLGYTYNFDYNRLNQVFTPEQLEFAKKHQVIPIATNKKHGLFMGMNNDVIKSTDTGFEVIGQLESLLKFDEAKIPVDYVEFELLGDTIPLGIIMAYHLGLGNLLATLKVNPRRVTRGSTYDLKPDEFIVKFEDEALIVSRKDRIASLLLSGFNRYKRDISRMSIYHFDQQEIYASLLSNNNINANKLVEVDMMFEMWIDPITRGLLEEMNMPTEMVGLLLKATELLTNDKHSDPNDASEQRDRGLERVSATIVKELYSAARSNQSKSLIMAGGLDLNPSAVWYGVLNDTSNMGVEESNPIHALKEQEELILGGTGGRSTRTLTAKDRKFSPESLGVISADTVDSGEVAAKIFTSADPNYTSLRGTTRKLEMKNLDKKVTKLMSTSMLLAPGADRDDPKRRNFINIQNSSSTFVKDQKPMPLRTGYERVVPHRFNAIDGDLWAALAEGPGVVESIKNNVITIKYADGKTKAIELGIRHGVWSGQYVPHEVITELNVGDKVEKGTVISYNKHYFKRDSLFPDQVIFANTSLARIVLWESDATYEDSSSITPELAARLETTFSEKRTVRVDFDNEVRNLVQVGDFVEADDLLCMLFPPLSTDAADRHDEISQDILERLSNESPRAKKRGKVTNIKVMYSGDIEEMTPSLRHLVEHYDGDLYRKCKQLKIHPHDGSTQPDVRIGGTEIGDNVVMLQIMIDYDLEMAGGDKVVWAHQQKSVPCEITTGRLESKTGIKIEGVFGAKSVEARMVRSIYIMGTTNRLLRKTGDDACAIFFRNAFGGK